VSHCNCDLHRRERRIFSAIQNGSRQQIRREMTDVLEDLYMTQLDRDVNDLILKGTWPGSAAILDRALARAKEHEKVEHAKPQLRVNPLPR
jgi:hypothetical protein